MKVHLQNEARHLFLQGKTLAEVALAVGISRSTAERWSVQFQWVDQRALLEYELRDKYIRENFNFYYSNLISAADEAYRVIANAVAERGLVARGQLAARRMRTSNRTMLAATKTYLELQNILNHLESYRRTARLG